MKHYLKEKYAHLKIQLKFKYINDHPEKWNNPASYIATSALKKAFPCKQKEISKTIKKTVNKLTEEYPDFNLSKIINKLKEIRLKDPEEANRLLNPQGLELLYLKYFNKKGI